MLDDILFVHPEGHAGRQDRDHRPRHHHEPPVRARPRTSRSTTTRARPTRVENGKPNHVIVPGADSAARVVYDYFGGAERFPNVSDEMMDAVDKADAAQFSRGRDPRPARLDPAELPDGPAHRPRPLPRLPHLELPADDAADRRLHASSRSTRSSSRPTSRSASTSTARTRTRRVEQIQRCAEVHDNLVVLDLRNEEIIHPTNRFMVYALFGAAEHLDPRALGPQAAEHRVRHGQVDHRPHEPHERRRAHARVRRRRPRGGRHVPGRRTTTPSACSASSSRASTPTDKRGVGAWAFCRGAKRRD